MTRHHRKRLARRLHAADPAASESADEPVKSMIELNCNMASLCGSARGDFLLAEAASRERPDAPLRRLRGFA